MAKKHRGIACHVEWLQLRSSPLDSQVAGIGAWNKGRSIHRKNRFSASRKHHGTRKEHAKSFHERIMKAV